MSQLAVKALQPSLVTLPADQVLTKINALLAPYNRTQCELTRDTTISADLEIDSIAVFDVIMEVEDAYDISFPMEAVADIRTIGDLADAIATLKLGA